MLRKLSLLIVISTVSYVLGAIAYKNCVYPFCGGALFKVSQLLKKESSYLNKVTLLESDFISGTINWYDLPAKHIEKSSYTDVEFFEGNFYLTMQNGEIYILSPTNNLTPLQLPEFDIGLSEFYESAKQSKFEVYEQDWRLGIRDTAVYRRSGSLEILLSSIIFLDGCVRQVLSRGLETSETWEHIYSSECLYDVSLRAAGGRIQREGDFAYLTRGDFGAFRDTTNLDKLRILSQSFEENSVLGVILRISLIDGTYQVFSKGHRNPQALQIINGELIEGEHGPYGGDEINHIVETKHYGWPFETFGVQYGESTWPLNKNNREHLQYQQPAFAFVPSVAISDFAYCEDCQGEKYNLYMSTLKDNSIYRLKLDKDFKDIVYSERIHIGERVRSIAMDEELIVFTTDEIGVYGVINRAYQ